VGTVAPVIVEAGSVLIRALLIPFAVLAGYFVAWGIVFCMDALVRAFFGTLTGAVSWIPYAGSVLTTPLTAVEKKLTSFLGGLEVQFENQMAARWHSLAHLMRQWAGEIEARALLDWQMAKKLAHVFEHSAAFVIGAALAHWLRAQFAKLHGATTVITVIKRVIEYPTVGKIGGAIHAGVRPIAHVIDDVLIPDIVNLRDRAKAAEREIGRLWKAVKARERGIAAAAVGAVLLTLLRRLGLNWIRCRNVKSVGKTVCGMSPNLLESLIAGSVIVAGSVSIVELTKACQEITGACEDGLTFFVREVK
jgi:hypothetical protein